MGTISRAVNTWQINQEGRGARWTVLRGFSNSVPKRVRRFEVVKLKGNWALFRKASVSFDSSNQAQHNPGTTASVCSVMMSTVGGDIFNAT